MLNPCREQTDKSPPKIGFGTDSRKSPFPVKKEHATVCQHERKTTSLRSSLGTIPREKRDASLETKEMNKKTGPGPADYIKEKYHFTDKLLTNKKSHNMASQHFNKAKKDTMKVDLYDYAYERSYKNVIGPGPAAYSEMYRANSTDQYQKTQFSKANRKLTQGEPGPGPSLYASHYSKDK